MKEESACTFLLFRRPLFCVINTFCSGRSALDDVANSFEEPTGSRFGG